MGIATSGLIRAEGNAVASVVTGDTIVIQRYQSNANGAYWVPYESTVDEIAKFTTGGTLSVRALGTATLNGSGTVSVSMASITAAALVFVTMQGTESNALSVVVTASTGFVIDSSDTTDDAVVNYIVYDV